MQKLKVRRFPGSKKKKAAPWLRVTCSCGCRKYVDIGPPDSSDRFTFMSIGDVIGTIADWRKLLSPMLTKDRSRQ